MNALVLVLIGRLFQMLIGFAALRVLTSLLGPAELGRQTFIVTSTTLFSLVLVNPVGMYVNRRLHAWQRERSLGPNLKAYSKYVLIVAMFGGICTFVARKWLFTDWPVAEIPLSILVATSLVFTTLNQTLIPSLNLLDHRAAWLTLSTATLLLALGLSAAFSISSPVAESWMAGQVAAFAALGLISIPIFRKTTAFTLQAARRPDPRSQVVAFSVPLAISVAMYWAQFQSYRLVVGKWVSLEDLGGFIGIYTLVSGLLGSFETFLQQYFYPRLYSKSSEGDSAREAWKSYANAALPLTIAAGIVLYGGAEFLVRLFLAPTFHLFEPLLGLAVFVECARVLGGIYGMAAQVSDRTKSMLLPQGLAIVALAFLVPIGFARNSDVNAAFTVALATPASIFLLGSALVSALKLKMRPSSKIVFPILASLMIGAIAKLFVAEPFLKFAIVSVGCVLVSAWILKNEVSRA